MYITHEPAAPALQCRRAYDCLCFRPPPEDEGAQPCPRPHRDCICRYTWRDCGWEKGDDHQQCPVHRPDVVIVVESPAADPIGPSE